MVHRIGKSFIFLVILYRKAFMTALSFYFLVILQVNLEIPKFAQGIHIFG